MPVNDCGQSVKPCKDYVSEKHFKGSSALVLHPICRSLNSSGFWFSLILSMFCSSSSIPLPHQPPAGGLPSLLLHFPCLSSPHLEEFKNFSLPCISIFLKLYTFDLVIPPRILRKQRLFMIKAVHCITFGVKGVCVSLCFEIMSGL